MKKYNDFLWKLQNQYINFHKVRGDWHFIITPTLDFETITLGAELALFPKDRTYIFCVNLLVAELDVRLFRR